MSIEQFSKQLSNGLCLVGEFSPSANSCAIGALVNTGSRDETPAESGLSHFLEHMLFKGTKKRSAKDINDYFGELGAQANAYTSVEHTLYYASILPESQSGYLELLTDMLQPVLDEDEFNMEKKVILEEIALKKDDPGSWFYMEAVSEYFKEHPLGNSVIGSVESVSALTINQMRDYYQRRYASDNIVLSIAGKFNWGNFCKEVEELCSDWKKQNAKREKPEVNFYLDRHQFKRKKLNISHLLYLLPGVSAQSEDRYSAALLNNIMADKKGSKLYWELVETGLVESMFGFSDDKDHAGMMLVYVSCEEKSLDKVKDIIRKQIDNLVDFSEQDLEHAKNKIASRIAISAEAPLNRMISIAEDKVYRNSLTPLSEIVQRIQMTNSERIRDFISSIDCSTYGEYELVGF